MVTAQTNQSAAEQLFFDPLRVPRDSYFVEYQPPIAKSPFATLSVVYPDSYAMSQVAETMRTEMVHWMTRYPVPVMVWASDAADTRIRPNGWSDDGCLIGWFKPGTEGEIEHTWKLDSVPAFLNDTSIQRDWPTIYKDVPFRTERQVKAAAEAFAKKKRSQNRILIGLGLFWLAVIPITWATIELFGPDWLQYAIYAFALYRGPESSRATVRKIQAIKARGRRSRKAAQNEPLLLPLRAQSGWLLASKE
jgi:hypothetical protein